MRPLLAFLLVLHPPEGGAFLSSPVRLRPRDLSGVRECRRPLVATAAPSASSAPVLAPDRVVQQDVVDVAIVGGGPAGLALALALQSRGKDLKVKVFEAVEELKERGSAVMVQPWGVSELDNIMPGLAQDVEDAGAAISALNMVQQDGTTINDLDLRPLKELIGKPFVAVTRHSMQKVMVSHLPPGVLELGHKLEGIHPNGPGGTVELTFAGDAAPVRARTVVGADGRKSLVRKEALPWGGSETADLAVTWWALADVGPGYESPVPKGVFRMSYGEKVALYYGLVEENVIMWSMTSWEMRPLVRDRAKVAEIALGVVKDWPEEVKDLIRNTPPEKMIETYVGDNLPPCIFRWSKHPAITLLGDAAHAMVPSLAMGVTTAVQDAAVLARLLPSEGGEANASELVGALRRYEKERIPPMGALQVLSRAILVFIEKVLCAGRGAKRRPREEDPGSGEGSVGNRKQGDIDMEDVERAAPTVNDVSTPAEEVPVA